MKVPSLAVSMTGKQEDEGGSAGFISWARLEATMRYAGEFRDGEAVRLFVAESDGITFYVGPRPT